jgi:hypothetical protein
MSNAFMAASIFARGRADRDKDYAELVERWHQKANAYEAQAVLLHDVEYEDVDALPEVEREAA